MSLAAGTRLGFYEVLSLLGVGGMGEVYRARDSRLGRDVAIKVLPADVARDGTRLDRFRREAKALAAIDHPNIVTVFSVEEAAGPGQESLHFLTMQLVEGQSLDHVIPASGLPLDRLLQIASAIAEALTAAHDKSIVHRDLKPANVMVATDGRVKVLDFGLAKDLAASGPAEATLTSAGHTQHGVVMGTPAYMSPEQVAGRAVDHRSDLFSLGILLYQMASGERPFAGASSAELASAILRDTPPLVTELRGDLPADLARLIRRCLEKDPGQRIQTARDVANECRDLSRQAAQSGGTPAPARRAGTSGASQPGPRPDEGFWVAVLPFKYSGSNTDLAALAEGLAEEIVTGLSRFSYLRVIARSSTTRDARYVMEGSLRQAGSQLRVAVQLVDTATAAHLWAETYERPFSPEAVFELQDDLVPRVVSTVADIHGVLPRSMSDAVRSKPADELSPYEAVLRSFAYFQRVTPDDLVEARRCLEAAVQRAPSYAEGWAMLAVLRSQDYGQGFDTEPDSLVRSVTAARRAVEYGPSNHLAWFSLAQALFFQKETESFRNAAERAVALNPMDGNSLAFMGELLTYARDSERGLELSARAKALNPHHPGWYWYANHFHAYRQRDYRAALEIALKVNLPGHWGQHAALAWVYGQLGERESAGRALHRLLELRPDFAATARKSFERWWDLELVDHLIDGLRKAGLDVANETVPPATAKPSIAVLPFTNMSADANQDYFSDGLADEIITLLARLSGLKVIARTSSFSFRGREQDVRRIAEALGVTHVLEGSVRRAGDRVRVTAQLIAAADGGHLWSERYDRELSDLFALQDDIASSITRALQITLSGATTARRYVPKVAAYEAFLKARHLQTRVTPESWALAKTYYESAVQLDPEFALAHVGLAFYWMSQPHFGEVSAFDAVPRARAAAEAALRIDGSLPEAHAVLGTLAAEFDFDWEAAERHFDAPMAREAGYPVTRPLYGNYLFMKGDPARAVALAERAISEDPLEVWPRMNLHAYLQAVGRDTEAFQQTQKVLELDPNLVIARVSVAHFHADWGEFDRAVTAARKAYEVGPWYPDARATLAALLKRSGAKEEARALRQSLGSGDSHGDSRAQAVYHLLCGDIDAGADWTEKAIAERDFSMMYYLRFVICKPLRASHRWPAIGKMVNWPGAEPK
jgi:TolB-like protein/Tfp pilus assembly protein PilF